MEDPKESLSYYWIFSLVTLPPVIPLYYLLSPTANPELYLKSFLCLQLVLSLLLLRMIENYQDISFRIFLVVVLLIPLPVVIFLSRLYLQMEFIGAFYLLVILYSLALYRFRKGEGFFGMILILLFGPLFGWGVVELLSNVTLKDFVEYSPLYILLGDGKFDLLHMGAFLVLFFLAVLGIKMVLSKVFKREVIF